MRVMVTRRIEYPRPGTPLTFSVPALPHPQRLPHDVRDFIIETGAGYLAPHEPGNKDGGLVALIESKRR